MITIIKSQVGLQHCCQMSDLGR